MKQTAVEWLEEQLWVVCRPDLFEQAKQMEKEQIMNAWDEIGFEWADSSEQYYNETYKNK